MTVNAQTHIIRDLKKKKKSFCARRSHKKSLPEVNSSAFRQVSAGKRVVRIGRVPLLRLSAINLR